jgi:hypothetical protein
VQTKKLYSEIFRCKPQASCDDVGEFTDSVNNFAID